MAIDLGMATNSPRTEGVLKNGSTATFQQDVIEASKSTPVLVDFWAPWCGPCKQLGPAIEKVVESFGGKVKLVKVDVDKNQALAGQMGVQSIPAVFAFVNGQPLDGFMGALPESDIRTFVQKIVDAGGNLTSADQTRGPDIEGALEAAAQAIKAGDPARAHQIYSVVLQHDPANDPALLGLAALAANSQHLDDARTLLGQVSEDGKKLESFTSIAATLQLAQEAEQLGSVAELETRLATNEDDHQARYDLALALNAKGFKREAAEALVTLMRRDRTWNEDGARTKLLELFEAWGPTDPATQKGRRLLSTALFS